MQVLKELPYVWYKTDEGKKQSIDLEFERHTHEEILSNILDLMMLRSVADHRGNIIRLHSTHEVRELAHSLLTNSMFRSWLTFEYADVETKIIDLLQYVVRGSSEKEFD